MRLRATLAPGLCRAAGELSASVSLSASTGLKGLKHRPLAKRRQDTQGVEEAAQLQPEHRAFRPLHPQHLLLPAAIYYYYYYYYYYKKKEN